MSKDHDENVIKANSVWLLCFLGICLLMMAVVYWTGTDMALFLKINSFSEYTGGLIWAILTFFSDGLVSFVILLPWIRRRPRIIWSVLLATLLFTLFGQVMKRVVNVPRPPQVLPESAFNLIGPGWGQHSFPSGHAAMIFILAGAFSFTTTKVWLRCVLIAGAFVVALSRVVVGVHWPLDVLAGMAIGWLAAWVGLILSKYTRWGWGSIAPKIYGAILLIACVLMFFVEYTGHDNIMTVQRLIAAFFLSIGTFEYLKLFGIHLFGKDLPYGERGLLS